MEIKKKPKLNLENYSKIFMQIGLVLTLFITYSAIENKTYDRNIGDLSALNMNADMEEEIPITERIEPEKPKAPPPPMPERIEVVEDEKEIEETIIKSIETDETEPVKVEKIVEIEEKEEIVKDISIVLVQDVPVFPGCKGNKAQLKECFNKKVQKHFSRKFDTDLPNELGLTPGRKKVHIGFKIDKNGYIVDIKARAPHPKIKNEVIKVMKLLPRMKPGKQIGKPVGVKYNIPFTLIVE